jgi:NAD(P)-dependent dehydrogenase (short-subunit alcohol dehydrogenase family)
MNDSLAHALGSGAGISYPTEVIARDAQLQSKARSPNCVMIADNYAGANRGIGFELATRFLNKGFEVFGTYRPQTRQDSSVTDVSLSPALIFRETILLTDIHIFFLYQLEAKGVKTFEVDFTDEASIVAAATAFGREPLDILINCAGKT